MADNLKEEPTAVETQRAMGANTVPKERYISPVDEDGSIWVRTSALIKGEPRHLYEIWRNEEAAPLWQERLLRVARTGEKTSHWVMQTGRGTVEWDAEVLADEPGRRIAWRSLDGDRENAGEVVFEEAPGGGGTYVTVLQKFKTGKPATAWARGEARAPRQSVVENLCHFKALVEGGGIPHNEGQPHGPRDDKQGSVASRLDRAA